MAQALASAMRLAHSTMTTALQHMPPDAKRIAEAALDAHNGGNKLGLQGLNLAHSHGLMYAKVPLEAPRHIVQLAMLQTCQIYDMKYVKVYSPHSLGGGPYTVTPA